MENKPIPALYCCYLLRLKSSASSQPYIGSTPNPRRRLAQHLGQTKGGARRTKRGGKDWTMSCIVTGFPSNIAALQFEWAWHNPHLTKRILDDERLVFPIIRVRESPRSGKTRKKPIRPHISLLTYLSHLHLLLRGPSFQGLPLKVKFFDQDVFDKWHQASKRVKGTLRPGIEASLDLKQIQDTEGSTATQNGESTHAKGKRRREAVGKGGVDGVDAGYGRFKDHVEKSLALLARKDGIFCAVCSLHIQNQMQLALVCPSQDCEAVSHMSCLASSFPKDTGQNPSLIPTSGRCPKCNAMIHWIDMVTEMSLRTRGEKELAQLMKKSKKDISEKPVDDTNIQSVGGDRDLVDDVPDELLPDDWIPQDVDSDDVASVASIESDHSDNPVGRTGTAKFATGLPIVIEDSEWDEADALD